MDAPEFKGQAVGVRRLDLMDNFGALFGVQGSFLGSGFELLLGVVLLVGLRSVFVVALGQLVLQGF